MKLLIASEGLTQKGFAEKVDMHYPHANKFFTGRAPNIEFINKVVKVFPDVDLNWLLLDRHDGEKVVKVTENLPGENGKVLEYLDSIEETIGLIRSEMSRK